MHPRRAISGLLCLATLASACAPWLPAASAADVPDPATEQTAQATGSIALTLAFPLPQRVDEVKERQIQLTLTHSDGTSAVVRLWDGSADADGLAVSVEALNSQGTALTTEQQLGYYRATLSGLALGSYQMTVTGRGYTPCTVPVTLEDYSQHVLLSTGDGTFSLGDVDGSGTVDHADRAAMDAHLADGSPQALAVYDLNGDGRINVIDLSYVNKMMDLSAAPTILATAAITAPAVDDSGVTVTGGSLEDLFTSGDSEVTLAPAVQGASLAIPMEFERPVTMQEISIASPSTDGAIQAGVARVETEDGQVLELPFDVSAPAGIHATGRTAGQTVVTINLGAKVAVKKVTITVTKVEGQTGQAPDYATVSQITFLQDIVSDAMEADTQVKNLAATAGDGEITLVWDSVKNVTGYTVAYGTGRDSLNQSTSVSTNRAILSGLSNNTTYYFQVTAVSGDWRGTPSAILSAVPLPAVVPGAPSNLLVESADTALRVSWGKTKDATYYQAYYRVQGAETWIPWGDAITGTSTTITGLTNGTVYEVAVKAGNQIGFGPYSAAALGTPKRDAFEMPELPADGRIPAHEITSIVMADSGNVNKNLCPNFTVDHLIDNDPNTYWIAANYWYNSNITYTFQSTHNMNYLLLVPYLDGAYQNRIANFTVTLKGEDGETLSTYYRDGMNITAGGYYILTFPETKGVKSVTLGLGEKTGGPRVSISEIAFYNSDTLADDIAALFADGAFTRLAGGADTRQIAALRERLTALGSFYLDKTRLEDELTLAQALLEQKTDALGLVKEDFQSRSAAAPADAAAGQTASDLQPLGVSAKAGSTLAIYAQLPDDKPVYVVPTQFYGESGVWKGAPVALHNGRNYLSIEKIGSLADTRGGVLYLTYAGDHPEQIRLQIRSGSGVYQMPVLELSAWYTMEEAARREAIAAYIQALENYVSGLSGTSLTTDIRNATELSTPSVLLSLPADQVLSGLKGVGNDESAMAEILYQNVLAWEEELFVANKVQGILAADTGLSGYQYPMTTRQNIRYMRMFAGAFMYAAGSHVGVEYGSTAALVQGRPTSVTGAGADNGLFGWGIAHEIGHNMDKLGKTEITNNIYSLALQAWDGSSMMLDTRLTDDGRWEDIFNKAAQGRPGAANNVFVQLGMYWQLHLAYDGADQPLAFFNAFFRAWKSGTYSSYSYDERVALIASQTANRNLTEFFTRWGMTLSQEVKDLLAAYPTEERAIWYLNDASRTYRLAGGGAAEGSAAVLAQVEESSVTLILTHTDSDSILGYEIRRNGIPIAFTTESIYVDDLGAANNLTYTYTAVPVDRLGNPGDAARSSEVRVAYDKTISPDLYTLERDGETVTITMKDGSAVPVTGIKVTGSGLTGGYTVKVKAAAGDEAWTTAKTGQLSGDQTVTYFNKPGAAPSDTRIWTYDAAVLTLTGIPQDARVDLLDYPGDRVDFYPDASVGVLEADYVYGSGQEDVIPAGTLVILGTYRGDPVYNYVSIEAEYNTTGEAWEDQEITTITRAMSGYGLLFAELPDDGAVSDTSDGFFLFVPDLKAEADLNAGDGVTDAYPLSIRAVFYRTDDPTSADSQRVTSQTLWISFPEGGADGSDFPVIRLTGTSS